MKKKVIFVAALATVLVTVVLVAWHWKTSKNLQGNYITKAEWEEMLSDAFGITQQGSTEIFGKDEKKYRPEDAVEGKYAAVSAMRMLGQSKMQIYLDTEEFVTEEKLLEVALQQGLVEKSQLKKKLTREECQALIALQRQLYDTEFWVDGYEKVNLKDGVRVEGQSYETPLSEGDMIIMQVENSRFRQARKVTGFDAKGEPICEEAKLEEVFESLVISEKVDVTADDVMRSLELDGWQISSLEKTDCVVKNVLNGSAGISSKGFKIHVKSDKNEHVIEFTNNDTGITYKKDVPGLKSLGNIDADLEVKELKFLAQVDYSPLKGLKLVDFSVSDDITIKGTVGIEAKKDDLKCKLLNVEIPLGGWLGATLEIYLCVSAEGSISVQFEFPAKYGICYEKGKGIRKYNDIPAFPQPSIEVDCKGDILLGVEPILNVLSFDVIDAELEGGAEFECKTTLHPKQTCFDVSASFPILTLSIFGDDEANVLLKQAADLFLGGNVSAEWELITAENAPIHLQLHFETKNGGPLKQVLKCTYEEEPVATQGPGSSHGGSGGSGSGLGGSSSGSGGKSDVPVDEEHFPDAFFRQYVLDNFDVNGNAKLEKKEIDDAIWIDFGWDDESMPYEQIATCTSLKGIEYLVKLKGLQCTGSSIEELDLRNNPDLIWLECHFCEKLKKLDVSKNTELQRLDVGEAYALQELDISHNKDLVYIDCWACNLSELEVSNNFALRSLDCSSNHLKKLDISKNTALTTLICSGNPIDQLDLRANEYLKNLVLNSTPTSLGNEFQYHVLEGENADVRLVYDKTTKILTK